MAIGVVSSAQVNSGQNVTPGAAAERLALWGIGISKGGPGAPGFTGATFGAQAMTQANGTAANATQRYAAQSAWYVKEANMPSGANAMTIATSGSPDSTLLGAAMILSGVDQGSPLVDTDTHFAEVATGLNKTVDVLAGGMVFVVLGKSEPGDTWVLSGFTKVFSAAHDFSGEQTVFYKAISADGTQAVAPTWTNSANASMLVLSLRPSGTTITAEGAGSTATASAAAGSADEVVATITHRLISKLGAAWANETGITVLIYKTVPSSLVAPDKRIAGVSTDASGNLSIGISDLGLLSGDTVWAIGMKDGSPAKGFIRKITPTYS